jgi:hypothetical protein
VRIASIFAASLALASAPLSAQVGGEAESRRIASDFAPPIDVWLDQISYDRGARMRPYFATEPGAYVTIIRVTSDGELRVMYPARPRDQKPYELGQLSNDRMPYTGDPASNLYESTGTGFVFAIASYAKFDYRYFTQGRIWSTARLATFARFEEPFQVMRRFVDRVLPEDADFSMDYEIYEVYSRAPRSAYASRYAYSTVDAYHDACLNAFGLRYNYYCRSYGGLYYGPIVVSDPRVPRPRQPKIKDVRPLKPYPTVPTIPIEPKPIEGRFPERATDERSARERYERQRREIPRVSERPFIYKTVPVQREPQREPQRDVQRSQPARPSQPETRTQPQMQGHFPRPEPRAPARVEVRNEPRQEVRPAPPSPPPAKQKEN